VVLVLLGISLVGSSWSRRLIGGIRGTEKKKAKYRFVSLSVENFGDCKLRVLIFIQFYT
jgi:hypothetical protein